MRTIFLAGIFLVGLAFAWPLPAGAQEITATPTSTPTLVEFATATPVPSPTPDTGALLEQSVNYQRDTQNLLIFLGTASLGTLALIFLRVRVG